MSDTVHQQQVNNALAKYWTEKIQYWLLCEEFRLKGSCLDQIAIECAFDAMNFMPPYLGKLRQRLLDLGVNENDILHPPFLI
jgi:hypothetical protein